MQVFTPLLQLTRSFTTVRDALRSRDAREFQIAALSFLLFVGIVHCEWELSPLSITITIGSALFFQLFFVALTNHGDPWSKRLLSLKSALISSLSLCLLLRTENRWILVGAAFIAIASKFLLKTKSKHLFNPTNLAILVCVRIIGQSWISPAQWGTELTILFIVGAAGSFVLCRADRLDVTVVYLSSLFAFECLWNCVYLGWPLDFVLHRFSIGSLYLFSFFMITDPRTIPDARGPRMVWTVCVAFLSSLFADMYYMNSAPLYALVIMTPFSSLIDRFFPAEQFRWNQPSGFHTAFWRKSVSVVSILLLFVTDSTTTLKAFCGFYAARADVKLYNASSQVIIARNGTKTTVTMESDVQGDVKDFAMIIPVPEVLKKEAVRVLDATLFSTLDAYSTPRLSEYWDDGPCSTPRSTIEVALESTISVDMARDQQPVIKEKVRVMDSYSVGEYDIVILSADESKALEQWLHEHEYNIPAGAADVIEPYIKSDLNFFVAKVNLREHAAASRQKLRPIQIQYNTSRFMLPIRLGMANADHSQDLTIYALSSKGRVECTNYRTVSMPTNKNLPEFVQSEFAAFYSRCFDREVQRRHGSCVFTEYAWDLSPNNYSHCDPCTGVTPETAALMEAGVDWLSSNPRVFFTRLHLRYDRATFPQDLSLAETYNTQNYQVLFTIHHPSTELNCDKVNAYLDEVHDRREEEIDNYLGLGGFKAESAQYWSYIEYLEKYRR